MSLEHINEEIIKEQISIAKKKVGYEPGYDVIILLGEKCLELMRRKDKIHAITKMQNKFLTIQAENSLNEAGELANALIRERAINDLLRKYIREGVIK